MAGASFQFDPGFIEEAVFWTARNEETVSARFHKERDAIYDLEVSEEERELRFRSFHKKYFTELGLESLFEKVVLEFPFILQAKPLIFIQRVWSKKEEDTELYQDGPRKTVLIRMRVSRLLDRTSLETFLRHELLRISDMLDPAFGYSPHASLGGASPIQDELIRERFRKLWDQYIDARLENKALSSRTQRELLKGSSLET